MYQLSRDHALNLWNQNLFIVWQGHAVQRLKITLWLRILEKNSQLKRNKY